MYHEYMSIIYTWKDWPKHIIAFSSRVKVDPVTLYAYLLLCVCFEAAGWWVLMNSLQTVCSAHVGGALWFDVAP